MNFSAQKVQARPLAARAQGTGRADGIAELPWLVAEILFGDEVLRDVPGFEVRGEDQLEFGFVLVLAAGFAVGFGEVGLAVVADDFKEGFVGAGDAFVLDVEDGVDEVFAHQGAEAVFEAEAGEDGGILGGGLAVEIELGGPPGAGAVFEFDGRWRRSGGCRPGWARAVLVSISRLPGSSRSWE